MSWQPAGTPKLALAVVHGHGEHAGRYEGLAEDMVRHGIAVFAVDLRGHGSSAGKRGHIMTWPDLIADALTAVDFAGKGVPADVEVVPLGHSVGGSIVLSAVVQKRLKPRRFAVSSPALRVRQQVPAWKVKMGEVLSSRLPSLTMGTGLDARGISRDAAVVEAYKTDPLVHDKMSTRFYTEWTAANAEILARANEIKVPYFASHGTDDPIIDPSGTQELFRRSGPPPGSRLELYSGYLHEPFNEVGRERVYEDLASWLLG